MLFPVPSPTNLLSSSSRSAVETPSIAQVKYPGSSLPRLFLSPPKSNISSIQPPFITASIFLQPRSFPTCLSHQSLAGLHFHLCASVGGSFTHRSQIMSHLSLETASIVQLLDLPILTSFYSSYCPLFSSLCSPAITQTHRPVLQASAL